MPPKKSSSPKPSSGGRRPSSPSAKGAAKAAAKAKAAQPKEEDPKARLEKEADEIFERFEPEGKMDGVLKLKEFADIIHHVNTRKCQIWGNDPCKIIQKEWKEIGGNIKKQVSAQEFMAWWPPFMEGVEKECAEKAALEEAKEAAAREARATKFNGDGVWQINVKDIPDAMREARKKGKTPLILDNTEGQRVEVYFTYSDAYIIECKKMIMDKGAKHMSVDDILEEERARFFRGKCFLMGKVVCFRLGNSACNFKGMFNGEVFPTLALFDRAQVDNCLGPVDLHDDRVEKSPLFKMATDKEDILELSSMGIHDKFEVVVITQFEEDSYEEFLRDMIPLELFQPMRPQVD